MEYATTLAYDEAFRVIRLYTEQVCAYKQFCSLILHVCHLEDFVQYLIRNFLEYYLYTTYVQFVHTNEFD